MNLPLVSVNVRQLTILATAWLWFSGATALPAATPPAERLLAADTIGFISIADFAKAKQAWTQVPLGQLWRDPELRPLREKALARFANEILQPLERQLGVTFADYTELLAGQVTIAWSRPGPSTATNRPVHWLVLADARDKTEVLTNRLAGLQKKWVDAGKTMRTERIRGVEFTGYVVQGKDVLGTLRAAFPGPGASADAAVSAATNRTEILVGHLGSLLLAANSAASLDKVLAALSGADVPKLADQPHYEAVRSAVFRDGLGYAWLSFDVLSEMLTAQLTGNPLAAGQGIAPEKLLEAFGLQGLKSMGIEFGQAADGARVDFFAAAPEASRKGLLRLLRFESKEASIPAFVPADAVKFNRWRLDGAKAWATLEQILKEVSPQLVGAVNLILETAGRDKDPDFDVRKSFIANLGDDVISYRKKPRGTTPEELDNPPSLSLLGSPNADQLALALRTISSLIPSDNTTVRERELLGTKIYALPLPAVPGAAEPERSLHFAAAAGYLALSTDVALVEEYIRGRETPVKPLRETSGLSEAAERVGGWTTGLAGFENQRETARSFFEAALAQREAPAAGAGSSLTGPLLDPGLASEWLDLTLLPPFERVAKYFHFTVYGGAWRPDGFLFKLFTPNPPALKP